MDVHNLLKLDTYEVLENMQEIAEFQQEELNRQPLAKIAA